VNVVMNFRVPYNAGKLPSGCTTCGLSSGTQLHRVRYIISFTIKIFTPSYDRLLKNVSESY
jgi:hypothetical protein